MRIESRFREGKGNAEERWLKGMWCYRVGVLRRNVLELPQHGRALRWALEIDGLLGVSLGGKGHVTYRDRVEEDASDR